MPTPVSPANVSIALSDVCRVQDGSTRTHSAVGTVTITGGRTYGVYVTRHHVRQTTAWEARGVHYGCELHQLDGRKVREDALVELRTLVERAFRRAVNEQSFAADKATQETAQAPAAPEAAEPTHYIITTGGAVPVVAEDEAGVLVIARRMGIADQVVRVDPALSQAEWDKAVEGPIVPEVSRVRHKMTGNLGTVTVPGRFFNIVRQDGTPHDTQWAVENCEAVEVELA